jgi:hypothetical protein
MGTVTWWRSLVLAAVTIGMAGTAATAGQRAARHEVDVPALFERLVPGMSVAEVAALAGEARLREAREPISSWLLWTPGPDGRGTTVLRAWFQDGRLTRLELESFGDEYRRLVKGADPWVEVAADELARIWRRSWRVERAAERCHDALDAYHELVVGAQERLVPAEQQAWARALILRREAEAVFAPGGSTSKP